MSTKTELIAWTKVQCLGEHHPVLLFRGSKGQTHLVFPKHKEDSDYSMERVQALLVLAPEFRCRCYEVLSAWRVYTHWSTNQVNGLIMSTRRERPEAIPLIKAMGEVAGKKTRRKNLVSPSDVLSLIPRELHPHAEEARNRMLERRSLKGERRIPVFGDRNGLWKLRRADRGHLESRHYAESGFRAVYKQKLWKHRNVMPTRDHESAFVDKWFRDRCEKAGLSGREFGLSLQMKSKPFNFIRNVPYKKNGTRQSAETYWMRAYWDNTWFRQICKEGFVPSSFPPEELWNPYWNYPETLIVARFRGASFSQVRRYHARLHRNADGTFWLNVARQPIQSPF